MVVGHNTIKNPLKLMRSFFKAASLMVEGSFEKAFENLKDIMLDPMILERIKVKEEVVNGIFQMVKGVVEKDVRTVVGALPMVKSLFHLPRKIDLLLSLVTALITRSYTQLERVIQEFCSEFEIDPTFVLGLISLAKRDYTKLVAFAQRFGQCDQALVEKFLSLMQTLGLLEPQRASPTQAALVAKTASDKTGAPNDGKGNLANLNYKELFQMADIDKSGALSFDEFVDILKYLNMPLSQNVSLRVFSECEKDGVMGPDEFEKAMHLLEDRVADKVLSHMGFSTQTLVLGFLGLTIILMMLFVFIFLGIGAFTSGGSFESVVNSVIAASAGGAVGQNRQKSRTERQFVLKDTLTKVLNQLKRAL